MLGWGGVVGVIYMAPLMEKPGIGLVALSQAGEMW